MLETSVTGDALLLAVAVGLLALLALSMHVGRLLTPTRPQLPAEDRAPAGLGRLIPVGAQVDQECRQGVQAIEDWLRAHRRR